MGVDGSVLVTGADGLLGSWLTAALLTRGERVVAVQRDRRAGSPLALMGLTDRVDIVDGDICEEGLATRVLNEYEVESVFHLAAQTQVAIANRSPRATLETNVRGAWLVLEACREHAMLRSVIVSSSVKAYGGGGSPPYQESHPLAPRHPYDVSKACADLVARSYAHMYGVPVAVTRFANVYGGGDINRARLVPGAVRAVLAGRVPVIRSDGSPERDFLYVEDAVAAYLALRDALRAGRGGGEAFNAGGGRPWRVSDVVELVCRLAGTAVAPEVRGTPAPGAGIDRQWLDSGKLCALTGWTPRVSLEEGLARTIGWYRAHPAALGLRL